MHELIILGLLQDGEYNGYNLKRQVDNYLAGIYSVNYGSLYPKFKKLEGQNCLLSRSVISEGGQQKVFYQITGSGIELFKEKMSEKPKESFNMALLRIKIKVLFFKYVSEKVCYDVISSAMDLILFEKDRLELLLNNNELLDEHRSSLLKHNLALLKSELAWLKTIKY